MSAPPAAVHVLSCPTCGQTLAGLEFDLLFACASCRVLVDPATRALTAIEVAAIPAPGRHVVWLPLWVIPLRFAVEGKGRASRLARKVAERTRRVYVAAFGLAREELHGEPGLVWTRRQDAIETRTRVAGQPFAVVGVRRGAAAAGRYVLPYLSQICDEQEDITGLRFAVTPGAAPWILAVPYHDEGHALIDGLSGVSYPAAAFEDLDELRRRSGP